jgi:hypothetical protein
VNWWQRFKRSSAHTQANIACTAIIMLATIAYSVIAFFQLRAMRGQIVESNTSLLQTLGKMQAQVEAEQTANKLTMSLVKNEQQAIVDLTIPTEPDSLSKMAAGLSAQFLNKGKVDATKFDATATLQEVALPSFKQIGKLQTVAVARPRLLPASGGHDGFESVAVATIDVSNLGAREIDSIKNQTTTFKMVISYSYGNGFGDTVSNTRCFMYVYVPPQPPSDQMWNSWDECNMVTNIYRSYFQHRKD